jgi:hypothetical protein
MVLHSQARAFAPLTCLVVMCSSAHLYNHCLSFAVNAYVSLACCRLDRPTWKVRKPSRSEALLDSQDPRLRRPPIDTHVGPGVPLRSLGPCGFWPAVHTFLGEAQCSRMIWFRLGATWSHGVLAWLHGARCTDSMLGQHLQVTPSIT